jgi:short-subunit dehydrogenase involved in D-alanine esterification of teichoic acids
MSIRQTVLIIGATSGIGAEFARRIHAQGKQVIATGRRQDRLTTFANKCPGIETSCFGFSDINSLPSNIKGLTGKYVEINTVIVSAGVQSFFDVKDAISSTPEGIANEVATNLTASMILCQTLVPYFLESKKPCSIILISSGLAYIPVPYFPVYCPTKAGIHSFAVALRAQLSSTNISVTDVSPPYVGTELDKAFKDRLVTMLGGPEKAIKPTPLEKFLDLVMKELDSLENGKPKREIAIGYFSEMVQKEWRDAFGPVLERFGVDG